MTVYFARLVGSDNARPSALAARILSEAKREAEIAYGDGFRDDQILIERENAYGDFVIVAAKRCRDFQWDNLSTADDADSVLGAMPAAFDE